MCVCGVDINPLANCIGCIFGSSELKSIRPAFHLSPSIFYLFLSSIALQSEPRSRSTDKHHTCVQACVFSYVYKHVCILRLCIQCNGRDLFTSNPPEVRPRSKTHHTHTEKPPPKNDRNEGAQDREGNGKRRRRRRNRH